MSFLVLFPVFIGTFFVAIAFGLGVLARGEVVASARAAARVAAIECGQGDSSWATDAQTVAVNELRQGGLVLGNEVIDPTVPGEWYVGTYCSTFGQPGGVAAVQVRYAEVNVFPVFTTFQGGLPMAAAWSFNEVASFPTE